MFKRRDSNLCTIGYSASRSAPMIAISPTKKPSASARPACGAARCPPDIQDRALVRLNMLEAAATLDDLRNPPSNRLHALTWQTAPASIAFPSICNGVYASSGTDGAAETCRNRRLPLIQTGCTMRMPARCSSASSWSRSSSISMRWRCAIDVDAPRSIGRGKRHRLQWTQKLDLRTSAALLPNVRRLLRCELQDHYELLEAKRYAEQGSRSHRSRAQPEA